MPPFVLDTSAVISVLLGEDGADRVLEIIEGANQAAETDQIFVPFIALMEVEYLLQRRLKPSEAERVLLLVERWPVKVEESRPDWRHIAARTKAKTPLSLADSWIAALAIEREAVLVHKDPEYDKVSGLNVERLLI